MGPAIAIMSKVATHAHVDQRHRQQLIATVQPVPRSVLSQVLVIALSTITFAWDAVVRCLQAERRFAADVGPAPAAGTRPHPNSIDLACVDALWRGGRGSIDRFHWGQAANPRVHWIEGQPARQGTELMVVFYVRVITL